jgi:NAD(P)-dependent dehydrogenase (short-subunit alcohol dehydrogenase family)
MKDFKGKVAVITGAAGGFGKELSKMAGSLGMKLMLTDIRQRELNAVVDQLHQDGVEVRGRAADISRADEVEMIAKETITHFGAVHLLFNNAGAGTLGPIWESSTEDWELVLGANLWGVIHGIRVFTPLMLAQGGEGHIVNTASAIGLTSVLPMMGVYCVSKTAVITLSESLYRDLKSIGSEIGVSVLCPGVVDTGIMPSWCQPLTPSQEMIKEAHMKIPQPTHITAADVAQLTFDAVRESRFYVLTHPELKPLIQLRLDSLLDLSNPINSPINSWLS